MVTTHTSPKTMISANPPQYWGNVCGGNSVSVLLYAHPQLFKVFKHLTYVRNGCGMQFERLYGQS
jgi:hypothetical protein